MTRNLRPQEPKMPRQKRKRQDESTPPAAPDHSPPYYGTRLRAMRFDDELWEAAKAKAAERGESVNGAVRDFLRRYVKR